MAKTVYSDNQNNVDALAERLSSQTSLSAERAKLVAYDLLCRKALKIKSSALAQIFRSWIRSAIPRRCAMSLSRQRL
ncbi:MAG: hypothetical protein ACLU7D_10055 [Collinsella sp.]